jgi:hypothetical protein
MNLAGFSAGEKACLSKLSTFFPPTFLFFGLREYMNRPQNVKRKVNDKKKIFSAGLRLGTTLLEKQLDFSALAPYF